MDANRPAPGPGGYGGLGAGSIVSKNIQPLLEADPRQIGPYAVRGRLGQGAMGSVYLGFAPTGQAFALKVLRQDFAADRDFRKRFTREIAAARAVHSPFVNAVTDADPNAATPWLASYFVPGPPLSAAVQLAGPFAPRSVAHLGVGIGLALQAIHTAGIVHRDLKPANVLVASDGPRVIDFGIARAVDASMLTATGMRLGTPSFMAPEQVAGIDVDAPADVWAVGGMLIYAATGRTPFGDGNAMAILYRVENHDPDLQGLEPALAHVAAKCLAKNPADRPTPTQLVEMCRAALSGGLAGHPALRGSDVTGWLPAAVSRDLAARAVELANIGQVVPGPGPSSLAAGGTGATGTGTGMSTGGGGKTGGLGGFLRRKGGGTGTGTPQSGHPGDQYSQGTAMSGGQGQYGQPDGQYGAQPGQGYEGQDPNGTGGPYGAPAPQYGAQDPGSTGGQYGAPAPQYGGQDAGGQYGAQQPGVQGGFGGQDAGGTGGQYESQQPGAFGGPGNTSGQYGSPTPGSQFGQQQGGYGNAGNQYGQQPPAGPSGQFGQQGDFGSPQPGAPAWGPSGPSGSDMPTIINPHHTPAPEPEGPAWRAAAAPQTSPPPPEPAILAGLPAGFTPIGEEAKRLAEAAESKAVSTPETGFGQYLADPSSFSQQPSTDDSSSGQSSASPFAPPPAAPPQAANAAIPQIAEPTFATNFNIPAVTSEPDRPAEQPASSFNIPQIAEPTFATNFNMPIVTPPSTGAGSDAPEGDASTPAPASSGISIPQIAEPTFATNFNIPVVKADAGTDGDDPDAPAARPAAPAVSVPTIAEPGWATGFMPAVKPEPPAEEDPAPKPITHAPPIPPHLQQPMTPPKGFGGPATTPNPQQTPQSQQQQQAAGQNQAAGQSQAGQQRADQHAQTQQIPISQPPQGQYPQAQPPFAPSQHAAPQSPFAPPQGHGHGQGQGYGQAQGQAQPPFAPPQAPVQQVGYQQQGFQQQGYQQQPQPPAPQQGQPQPQHGFPQQPPHAYPPPQAYQPQPPQQRQPPQPQFGGGFQQLPHQNPPRQDHFPQDHIPQAGGMTIVPLPPPMESPYGVPERAHGPGPTSVDTPTKGWSSWSSAKRITVLAIAGIVVVGAIVGAILALSGGSTSKSGAPTGNGATTTGASSQAPTTAAAAGPIGAQQGAPGARDVVLRGLYIAAADRDFQTVCAAQTVAAQKGAAKGAGWNGQGDPMPSCVKYFQDNWSAISADYLRGRQVTDVKPGPTATTMTVTVNDPPPAGGGSTRSFTVVWQDTHWLLEAAGA